MRVVLDTNTVISALLFSGTASRLVPLWRSRRIVPVLSKEILDEYVRILAYPKLELTGVEIGELIELEILPHFEPVVVRRRLRVVKRDPSDDKFLECAVAADAACLVTGDRDLLEIGSYRKIPILPVGAFLERVMLEKR